MGSPSVDLLHLRGRSVRSAGGAGLYTGLAAQRAGVEVSVVAPRPDPMPPELTAAAEVLDWIGPAVPADALPHFEIEYTSDGDTVYHRAVQGSEGSIRFEHLPTLRPGDYAYVVPLIDPELQLAFARHLKGRGLRVGCGTYRGGILGHRAAVEAVVEVSDFFFCNEVEAGLLFGSIERAAAGPGKVLVITRGASGARLAIGSHAVDIDPVVVEELDATGAGDAFCGTTLARVALGDHPVVAARRAAAAAAETVTRVGPERLLDPAPLPAPAADGRAAVDRARIARLAGVIARAPEARPFDFTGPDYPEPGHPSALDFFFAGTVQQFGFWTESGDAYGEPMIARLGGRARKGSDYLWAAYRRWLAEAPDELAPAGHAALDRATFDHRLRDDSGANPLPASALHARLAASYGRDMVALGWTPQRLLELARESERPLAAFLSLLDRVGGYKEDPWRKKSALLAAILSQRPEGFLGFGPGEDVPPIVDYHCMRGCLRTGVVVVPDAPLASRLRRRLLLEAPEEEAVRSACATALAELRRASGRPMGAVDWFFFQNRRRCPEMIEPECAECPADPVCAHRKELFQPVIRTTAY